MNGVREIDGKFFTLYEVTGRKDKASELAASLRNRGYFARVVRWTFGKMIAEGILDDYAVYIFPKS